MRKISRISLSYGLLLLEYISEKKLEGNNVSVGFLIAAATAPEQAAYAVDTLR